MNQKSSNLQELVVGGGPLGYPAMKFLLEIARQLEGYKAGGSDGLDICPSNIVVTESGLARLGVLNKPVTESDSAHSTGPINRILPYLKHEFTTEQLSVASEANMLEAADYLAPERALNNTPVDARADIYSLGCVLYFMLMGRPPFASGSISERLLAHQTRKPDSIGETRPDVPQELVAICERMFTKKPEERYQSLTELISAISLWKE
jgi:eukaryotic-like serine/threonine-protein kinase